MKQWLWLIWQSGSFQYQRFAVQIQTPANFCITFIYYCQLYCIEKTKIKEKEAGNGPFFKKSLIVPPKSWSSLDKEESLACQITSPFNKKMGAFCMATFLIYFKKQLSLLLNGEVIWQSSGSSSSKELHSQIKCPLSLWPDVIFLVNNWATLLFEHLVTLALVYLMVSKVNSLMMISVLSFANF